MTWWSFLDLPFIHTCLVACMESLPLDWGIRVEHHVHLVSTGCNGVRQLAPTVPPQAVAVDVSAIKDLNVVIGAFLVGLQFKVDEGESDAVPWGGGEMPHTVLAARIEVGPVRAADFTFRVLDFVLTATYSYNICAQDKPIK